MFAFFQHSNFMAFISAVPNTKIKIAFLLVRRPPLIQPIATWNNPKLIWMRCPIGMKFIEEWIWISENELETSVGTALSPP